MLRQGSWQDACNKVIALLNREVDPQSLWDALFQHAAEMMMRRPAIVALHACTTTNALHYLYEHSSNDETQRFLLLQNAAFLTMFRRAGGVGDGVSIDTFHPFDGTPSLADIFTNVSNSRIQAAQKTLAFLEQTEDPQSFIAAAQRMIYLKGTDSHDYKFSYA